MRATRILVFRSRETAPKHAPLLETRAWVARGRSQDASVEATRQAKVFYLAWLMEEFGQARLESVVDPNFTPTPERFDRHFRLEQIDSYGALGEEVAALRLSPRLRAMADSDDAADLTDLLAE